MKILSLANTFFLLPDDFNGKYPDALRILADYIESDASYLDAECKLDINADPWLAFEEVQDNGGKLSGIFGLKCWNGTEWETLKGK